jgi:hypothetical protein
VPDHYNRKKNNLGRKNMNYKAHTASLKHVTITVATTLAQAVLRNAEAWHNGHIAFSIGNTSRI